MTKCSHRPPAETEDKRRRVWCACEVELSIAYESFGTELVGILVYFRIVRASPESKRVPVSVMSALIRTSLFVPDVGENDCAGGNEVSTELVILHSFMRECKRQDDLPSQRLLHDSVDVDEAWLIVKVREATATDYGIQFGLGFLLHLRVERQRDEETLHCREHLGQTRQSAPPVH